MRLFLNQDEKRKIRETIKEIEARAHTRIVIQVIPSHTGTLYDQALKLFSKHRLHHEKIKTGILLLISMKDKQFQILGDEHIHQKIGKKGWDELAARLSEFFKEGKFYAGLIDLLENLEKHLVTHFPKEKTEQNA